MTEKSSREFFSFGFAFNFKIMWFLNDIQDILVAMEKNIHTIQTKKPVFHKKVLFCRISSVCFSLVCCLIVMLTIIRARACQNIFARYLCCCVREDAQFKTFKNLFSLVCRR